MLLDPKYETLSIGYKFWLIFYLGLISEKIKEFAPSSTICWSSDGALARINFFFTNWWVIRKPSDRTVDLRSPIREWTIEMARAPIFSNKFLSTSLFVSVVRRRLDAATRWSTMNLACAFAPMCLNQRRKDLRFSHFESSAKGFNEAN